MEINHKEANPRRLASYLDLPGTGACRTPTFGRFGVAVFPLQAVQAVSSLPGVVAVQAAPSLLAVAALLADPVCHMTSPPVLHLAKVGEINR